MPLEIAPSSLSPNYLRLPQRSKMMPNYLRLPHPNWIAEVEEDDDDGVVHWKEKKFVMKRKRIHPLHLA